MKIGIIEYIDSMHYLKGHNQCEHPHGHTYKIEVMIEGKPQKGMVMDFGTLRKKVRSILDKFDHINLNEILEYPTCENLCIEIHKKIKADLKLPVTLRVWEGHNKWAEVS
jgi:6-pyruvoyltetrahydropterin/6-carboxytetrahydropterin synthase